MVYRSEFILDSQIIGGPVSVLAAGVNGQVLVTAFAPAGKVGQIGHQHDISAYLLADAGIKPQEIIHITVLELDLLPFPGRA